MLKYIVAISCLVVGTTAMAGTVLQVNGNFLLPKKAGAPPVGWRLTSGRKGTMEVVPSENGNNVILSAEPKGSIGLYSAKVKVKAGDKISLSAKVIGEKISFAIFQYGKTGTTVQRQELKGGPDGRLLKHVFTVTDSPKGPTEIVRVAFIVDNGQSVAVSNVEAEWSE
jgi:hypothetical protein